MSDTRQCMKALAERIQYDAPIHVCLEKNIQVKLLIVNPLSPLKNSIYKYKGAETYEHVKEKGIWKN